MSTSKDLTKDAKKNNELTADTSWMKAIWKWADDNKLNEDTIPRNSSGLLALEELLLDSSSPSRILCNCNLD